MKLAYNLASSVAAKARRDLACAALRKLGKLFRNEFLDRKVKILLYKQVVRSILLYGAPIWANCNESTVKMIKAVETRALRMILNKKTIPELGIFSRNSTLYEESKLEPVSEAIHKLSRNFRARYLYHRNDYIRTMARSKPNCERKWRGRGRLKMTRFVRPSVGFKQAK